MLVNATALVASLAFVARNSLIVSIVGSTAVVVTIGAPAFLVAAAATCLLVPYIGPSIAPIYLTYTTFYGASI